MGYMTINNFCNISYYIMVDILLDPINGLMIILRDLGIVATDSTKILVHSWGKSYENHPFLAHMDHEIPVG
jgi:hypothetical protein